MLKTIKIKPKKEIQIPSYNELFKELSKKKKTTIYKNST